MKKMIWFTTLSVIFSVLILPGLLALGVKYLPSGVQPPLHKTKDVYGERFISQEFTSFRSNLTGIAMTVKNPNLKNKKDVFLHVYDENSEVLRETKLNGANIEDGNFVKFLFNPISDSKGKAYKFIITSPESGEGEVLPIFYTDEKPVWSGLMMFEDNEGIEGSVSFVTLHKPESKLEVVSEIYSDLFSRLFRVKV